jgi:hypothetical protein
MTYPDKTWIDMHYARGGQSHGDIQAGEDHTRRYRRANGDGTWTVVDFIWAAVSDGMSEYGADCLISTTVCGDPDDPGSSEISGDNEYTQDPKGFLTAEEADRRAEDLARRQGEPR